MSKYVNYCHNKLSEIFNTDRYDEVLKKRSTINPMLKAAIDRAFEECTNKQTFKKLVQKYAKLTPLGIKECEYCQTLLLKL